MLESQRPGGAIRRSLMATVQKSKLRKLESGSQVALITFNELASRSCKPVLSERCCVLPSVFICPLYHRLTNLTVSYQRLARRHAVQGFMLQDSVVWLSYRAKNKQWCGKSGRSLRRPHGIYRGVLH